MMSTERWQLSNFNLKFLSPFHFSRGVSSLSCCCWCFYVHCIPTSADCWLFWWRRKYFDLKISLISGEMKMLIFFCCVDVYLCWMNESFSSWLLSKSTYHCPLLPCHAPLLLSLIHKLSILRYSYRDSDAVIAMPSRRCRLHSLFLFSTSELLDMVWV